MKDFGENPLIYSICLYSHLVCINLWFEIDLLIFVIQCKHCTFHPRKNLLWLIWIDFIVIISTKVSKKRLWKVWLLLWASGARVSLDHSYLFVNENTCADNISLCNTWRSLMNNYNWLTIDNRLLLIHRDFKIGSLKKHRLKPRGFYSSIKEVYRI